MSVSARLESLSSYVNSDTLLARVACLVLAEGRLLPGAFPGGCFTRIDRAEVTICRESMAA